MACSTSVMDSQMDTCWERLTGSSHSCDAAIDDRATR